MTKRYVAYTVSRKDRAGNIVRGFVMGLAEFGSFGTRLYDLSGYPHESEAEAIYSDWQSVGNDMRGAINKSQPEPADERDGRRSAADAERDLGHKKRGSGNDEP